MIWNPNKECMSRDEMSALQGKRLHKIVEYVYHNVPFYRNKLQAMDIRPDDIQTIEDIKKLPFTTKQDLRDNYPFGLQAAPQSEIIRIHASSGTTGKPTIVGYTRKDIGVWSETMARCLTAFGVSRDYIFSVAYGYGLFTGPETDSRPGHHRYRLYPIICSLSGRDNGETGHQQGGYPPAYRCLRCRALDRADAQGN